jgi:hypothetical protein
MQVFQLDKGKGRKNSNVHLFEITEAIRNSGEYFQIEFVARHPYCVLSWKLRDESGCHHTLPYFFKHGDLKQFTIIVDGFSGESDYSFQCDLKVWPKDLLIPTVEYQSITTVYVGIPYNRTSIPPKLMIRRKGDKKWKSNRSDRITFDRDEIYEAQLVCPLPNNSSIQSPIFDVQCMWRQFDFEKESKIEDFERLILGTNFYFVLNNSNSYSAKYIASMRMIGPVDHDDYNIETEIESNTEFGFERKEFKLIAGARYELKLHIMKLNISFSRIIDIPNPAQVDESFWKIRFGDVDHVTFSSKDATTHLGAVNWVTREQEIYETKITLRSLKLYKRGVYSYKSTYQEWESATPAEKSYFGGTFRLVKIDDTNIRIELTKFFKRPFGFKPSGPILSIPDPTDGSYTPTPFQLPELLNLITYYAGGDNRLTYRLVCKSWCLVIDPTISGTLTSTSTMLLGFTFSLDREKK